MSRSTALAKRVGALTRLQKAKRGTTDTYRLLTFDPSDWETLQLQIEAIPESWVGTILYLPIKKEEDA
jgi:hypothetical protein